MANNVDNVKERLAIEEVVGQYVELRPAGTNLKGRCPFHNEKTPSFMVSPSRQTYHCFGCGVGGDMFSFIEAIEGLDFRGALKLLADKAGVELTNDRGASKEDRDEKDTLFAILEAATQYYVENFSKNTEAQKYLKDRGLTEKTMEDFRIGFAPDSWSGVLDELKKLGFTEADIDKAGLIRKGDSGRYYDRFRSRIMFPVNDSAGRVVAYSGRIFGKEDDKTGKYINSPETTLYHKSKILYGYDRARQAIRKTNFAILVEGQMDLIATHQAGYTNTVAISGTALTTEQIGLIGRMAKNLCIALDADDAGIASAGKSARLALRAGFDVKIAELPEGADPADMLAGGDVDTWKASVKNSKHIIDFLLDRYRKQAKDERAFKLTVQKEVLPYLLDIESEIDKSHFIQRVAAQLSVSEEAVRRELMKIQSEPLKEAARAAQPVSKQEQERMNAEEELVLMYMWQSQMKEPFIDLPSFRKQVEEVITPIGFNALEEKLSNNSEAAFRFESLYDGEDQMKSAILELLERLTTMNLRKELDAVTTALRKAESEGNNNKIAEYEKKSQDIFEQLAKL